MKIALATIRLKPFGLRLERSDIDRCVSRDCAGGLTFGSAVGRCLPEARRLSDQRCPQWDYSR